MIVNELVAKLIVMPPNAVVKIYGGLEGEDLVDVESVDRIHGFDGDMVKIW